MEEKRRHQRYSPVDERKFVAKYENKNRLVGEVKDFSRSGLSFASKERLKKEKQVKIDLQISGLEQKVPADIKILWSRGRFGKYTYGAAILDMKPENKFDILDLLYQDWRQYAKPESLLN